MVCVACGRVAEFADPLIEERQAVIAARYGFRIENHSLVIYGVCADCVKE